MSSPVLLMTEVPVAEPAIAEATGVWQRSGDSGGVLYQGVESSSLLELTPLAGLAELDKLTEGWETLVKDLRPLMTGDVRRQLLQFIAAPRPVEGELPESTYVQIRHVEVKPPVYEEYLAWREGTIFAEVHKNELIEGFLAYHSLVSTEPGVTFVSGFSCEPSEYLPTFATERYAEIARQAHPKFVTDQGLYTRIYRRVGA